MSTRRISVSIIGAALLGSFAAGVRADEPATPAMQHPMGMHDMDMQHDSAKSDHKHADAAKRFYDEAAQLEKQAAEHEQDAAQYRQRARLSPKANYGVLAEHCDKLAKSLRASAEQARETGKLHEDVGKMMDMPHGQ